MPKPPASARAASAHTAPEIDAPVRPALRVVPAEPATARPDPRSDHRDVFDIDNIPNSIEEDMSSDDEVLMGEESHSDSDAETPSEDDFVLDLNPIPMDDAAILTLETSAVETTVSTSGGSSPVLPKPAPGPKSSPRPAPMASPKPASAPVLSRTTSPAAAPRPAYSSKPASDPAPAARPRPSARDRDDADEERTFLQKFGKTLLLPAGILMAVAVIILAALYEPTTPNNLDAAAKNEYKMTAEEYWQQFVRDNGAASLKFEGNSVELTGRVRRVVKDASKPALLLVTTSGASSIECQFDSSEALQSVKTGDEVVVGGKGGRGRSPERTWCSPTAASNAKSSSQRAANQHPIADTPPAVSPHTTGHRSGPVRPGGRRRQDGLVVRDR